MQGTIKRYTIERSTVCCIVETEKYDRCVFFGMSDFYNIVKSRGHINNVVGNVVKLVETGAHYWPIMGFIN